MRDVNRFRGCLVGGAIGDALGYPIEFLSEDRIFQKYGPEGIRRYDLENGVAQISDDTQMTLFTAVGLLFGMERARSRGVGSGVHLIPKAYMDWYWTQTQPEPPEYQPRVSWIANFREFYTRRAPGSTCLNALSQGGRGTVEDPVNHSKGCGGVMRVAPIGLYFCDWRVPPSEVARIGADAAAVTHGHELGYIPAAALTYIIHALTSGRALNVASAARESVAAVEALFPQAKHMPEFRAIMEKALSLAGEVRKDTEAIRELGEGWVAEEALAIAVYCAVKYETDFEKAIVASVNHSGDSDSTGSITGQILGALLGCDALPDFWVKDLELKDFLLEIADDLCFDGPKAPEDRLQSLVWQLKYETPSYRPAQREQARNGVLPSR